MTPLDPRQSTTARDCIHGRLARSCEICELTAERDNLRTAYERLTGAMCHVINRVSAEGRDDENGHIFLVGEQALRWAEAEARGTVPESQGAQDPADYVESLIRRLYRPTSDEGKR